MNLSNNKLNEKYHPRLNLSGQRRNIWYISLIAIFLSLTGLIISSFNPSIGSPLKLGLDFTGGTQIKIERDCTNQCSPLKASEISTELFKIPLSINQNYSNKNVSQIRIQLADSSKAIVLSMPFVSAQEASKIIDSIKDFAGPIKDGGQSIDTIGPTLGVELLRSSFLSLIVAFLGISFYIAIRYDKTFAWLALVALAHDLIIICGIFAWLGIISSVEIDRLFAVSLLTIAGYSVNDTVVVFDRIREQARNKSFKHLSDQIDYAVSATFTRTLYTSGTTLLPLIALIIFGGSTLYWFSISLGLGVVVGTWSSIALAPSLYSLKESLPIYSSEDIEENFEDLED
tara:strand:- start:432 stop:1460 length:1029 start_codon:yes stop_codon:yes gene_type:complete